MTQKQHFGKIKEKLKVNGNAFHIWKPLIRRRAGNKKEQEKKSEMGKREQDSEAAGDKE